MSSEEVYISLSKGAPTCEGIKFPTWVPLSANLPGRPRYDDCIKLPKSCHGVLIYSLKPLCDFEVIVLQDSLLNLVIFRATQLESRIPGGVRCNGRGYLGFAGAVQDVDERSGELFFSSQADGGFQSVAEQQVVGADVLRKLFVLLHRQDDDTLITSFDSHRRHGRLP